MFNEPKNLIVVYKDEMLLNFVRKLVETNDDSENGEVIGTKDGSVKIVAWDEKTWLVQKKKGVIDDKILFLGNIKGTDNLAPMIDNKFNKWSVKYGWSGKQALIEVDEYAIKKEDYDEFLKYFKANAMPDNKKTTKTGVLGVLSGLKRSITVVKYPTIAVSPIPALVTLGTTFAIDYFSNKSKMRQQLLVYGIYELYYNHLDKFMNA